MRSVKMIVAGLLSTESAGISPYRITRRVEVQRTVFMYGIVPVVLVISCCGGGIPASVFPFESGVCPFVTGISPANSNSLTRKAQTPHLGRVHMRDAPFHAIPFSYRRALRFGRTMEENPGVGGNLFHLRQPGQLTHKLCRSGIYRQRVGNKKGVTTCVVFIQQLNRMRLRALCGCQ